MNQVGTKYTANGIIFGGLKSEILSATIALSFYWIAKKIRGLTVKEYAMVWKVYFWFVVILIGASVPFYIKTLRSWELIDIAFMIPAMIGLFGFTWKKQILRKEFWKVFFIGWVLWTPLYHFVIPLPSEVLKAGTVSFPQWLIATLAIIPAIPHFIAIFRYAFSNLIAGQTEDNAG